MINGERFGRRSFLEKAGKVGAAFLIAADVEAVLSIPSDEAIPKSNLEIMREEVSKMEERIKHAKSQPVKVMASFKNGIAYNVKGVGDSLAVEDCSDLSTPQWQGIVDAVNNKFPNLIAINSEATVDSAEIGADSGRVRQIVANELLPNTFRMDVPIFVTSFGPNDAEGFLEGNQLDIFNLNDSKPIIDSKVKTFRENAGASDRNHPGIFPMLLGAIGSQPLKPQVIALLIPDITQTRSYKEKTNRIPSVYKEDLATVSKYLILSLNSAIIDFAEQYHFSFVDLYDQTITQNDLCADGFHPADEGYKVIIELIARLFELEGL